MKNHEQSQANDKGCMSVATVSKTVIDHNCTKFITSFYHFPVKVIESYCLHILTKENFLGIENGKKESMWKFRVMG